MSGNEGVRAVEGVTFLGGAGCLVEIVEGKWVDPRRVEAVAATQWPSAGVDIHLRNGSSMWVRAVSVQEVLVALEREAPLRIGD